MYNNKTITLFLAILCFYSFNFQVLAAQASNKQTADMIIINAKIATVDPNFSIQSALAIKDGQFIYVGNQAGTINYQTEKTHIIDAQGAFITPGLIDAHVHMQKIGLFFQQVNLVDTTSYEEILTKVAERIKTAQPGEWILGRGWDQNDWPNKTLPMHDALSKISPNNPVALTRIDGHALLVNNKALQISEINSKTTAPAGGEILKKPNRKPTGVLVDNAMNLVKKHFPEIDRNQSRQLLVEAANASIQLGLTSIHDAGVGQEQLADYKYLVQHDLLPIRSYVMMWDDKQKDIKKFFEQNREPNYLNKNMLAIRSIKMMIDGALGSRGAALLENYSDANHNGLLVTSKQRLLEVMQAALQTGIQVNTHAIGDRGNRFVLDTLEQALQKYPVTDHRFRDEHTQIINLADLSRFNKLGLIPSMQPLAATSDMYWAETRIGAERIKGGYVWQSLIKAGNIIPLSSDFPVDNINPLHGFYAAITRQDAKNWPEKGWMPEEKLTREQALKGFTIWAAQAAFQEKLTGSIEVGKLADLTILNTDLLTANPTDIRNAKVLYTIIGGQIKYQRQ